MNREWYACGDVNADSVGAELVFAVCGAHLIDFGGEDEFAVLDFKSISGFHGDEQSAGKNLKFKLAVFAVGKHKRAFP